MLMSDSFVNLYATLQEHPRSIAIQAVAKANGLDLKTSEIQDKRTPEHLKASGLGKVPAFIGEDGYTLSEAIAIAIYSTLQEKGGATAIPRPQHHIPVPVG